MSVKKSNQKKKIKKKIKTGSASSSSKKAKVSKSSTGKNNKKKSVSEKPEIKKADSKKIRNTNLRLIKNGDLPVDEPPVKKPPKKKVKTESFYEDKPKVKDWLIQHKSLVIIGLSVFALIVSLAIGYYYVITNYKVTTVYVDGNIHYTNEEIMNMVMIGRYGDNSLYLAAKYKDKGVEGVPFVEKMDVNILSPNTIRINVYEKALAGYVEYLGQYMYFDKDGIIVESSSVRTASIPQVTGLSFDYVVMYEPLPVENDEIFKQVLSITQLLTKYDLAADKIFFDSSLDLTLYFQGVRVTLGSSENLDEKIMKLQYILPELEGRKGTLQMENITEDTKNITFNQN